MSAPLDVELEDTTRCPVAERCEGTGTEHQGDLRVAIADTSVGVLCVTLCGWCEFGALLPTYSAVGAAKQVCQHCEHLGIDVDQAAALAERGPVW